MRLRPARAWRSTSRLAGRRRRLCSLASTWLLLAVLAACTPEPGPPNVVLVVLDTVRADALSAYGHPRPVTPRIDAIAREGVRFDRAFATDFWTLPSHASLLTGLHPSEHGATSETNRLPEAIPTVAERLAAAGYRTAAFVSNAWLSRERGFGRGFDRYREGWSESPRGADALAIDRDGLTAALDWIDGEAGAGQSPKDPFFVFFNWNSAHLPYQPDPSRYVDLYPDPKPIDRMARLKEVSGGWDVLAGSLRLDAADLEALRTLYDAEVAGLDALVGRLADALASRGMLDDTLLIVTSDHGEAFGEHGLIDHLFSMYDTTVRVPLVIRFPPRFPPGTVREELVSLVDVVPTILDVTGVGGEQPRTVDRSLARPGREARAFVVAENERPVHGIELMERRHPDFDMEPYDHRLRMIRTDTHKLIWHGDGDLELYDVAADPLEQDDRAGTDPATRERLERRLEEWMARHEGAAPEAELFESRDPRALEQLRALGYIE